VKWKVRVRWAERNCFAGDRLCGSTSQKLDKLQSCARRKNARKTSVLVAEALAEGGRTGKKRTSKGTESGPGADIRMWKEAFPQEKSESETRTFNQIKLASGRFEQSSKEKCWAAEA